MDDLDPDLIIDSEMEEKMKERGIQRSDIKEVLVHAEKVERLYIEGENRYLGKKRLGNFTVYAEYEKGNDGYKIRDVYSHRVSLSEDQE